MYVQTVKKGGFGGDGLLDEAEFSGSGAGLTEVGAFPALQEEVIDMKLVAAEV